MADVPFLGCKISLISKCDIRYEGILYCVDAKESTIALSKVKSYGTESRGDPSHYVAPKNDVYDIIIFRASDVKDLRVDAPEPPGLSDPAIISAHHSYSGQSPSTSSFNNINNSNTATSSSATNPSTTATSTTAAATTTNNLSSGLASALNTNGSLNSNSGPSNQQKQQQHQKPLLPFLPTGSSNNNNSNNKDQQPINYSSAVANNAQRRARQQEPRDNNNKRSSDDNKIKQQVHENNRRDRNDRRREDGDRNDRRHERRNDGDRRIDHDTRPGDGGRRGGSERRDDGGGGRRGGGGDRSRDMRMTRSGYDRPNHNNHVNSNNMRYNNSNNNYNSRRGPINRDNYKGGPPMYRRGGPMQGGRRARSGDRSGSQRGHPRKGAPLKFEGDYNFDEANKIFLELEGKFKGMKLNKDGETNAKEKDAESSGCDGVTSKSPAGQSESGSGYDSEDQNNKDGDSKDEYGESVSGDFYDRAKSFFDNISCEASERSQGKVNKPDWRKERQLNAETFGVSANYRRGGYRGRHFEKASYHRRQVLG